MDSLIFFFFFLFRHFQWSQKSRRSSLGSQGRKRRRRKIHPSILYLLHLVAGEQSKLYYRQRRGSYKAPALLSIVSTSTVLLLHINSRGDCGFLPSFLARRRDNRLKMSILSACVCVCAGGGCFSFLIRSLSRCTLEEREQTERFRQSCCCSSLILGKQRSYHNNRGCVSKAWPNNFSYSVGRPAVPVQWTRQDEKEKTSRHDLQAPKTIYSIDPYGSKASVDSYY